MFGKLTAAAGSITQNISQNVSQNVSENASENVSNISQNVTDTVQNPDHNMPSKGIQCYTYIGVDGVEVQYSVPKQDVTKRDRGFAQDHLEVEKKNIGALRMTGRFQFVVRKDGHEVTNQWCDINALTGKSGDFFYFLFWVVRTLGWVFVC
jgi:hypothetical protein